MSIPYLEPGECCRIEQPHGYIEIEAIEGGSVRLRSSLNGLAVLPLAANQIKVCHLSVTVEGQP